MKKSSIILFTVISTLISLVFIILTYYGITRYIELNLNKPEKYIQNYSNLSGYKNKNIILTFTSNPKNFSKLKPMLNSILDQTVKVNQIYFVVPYKYQSEIPKYIKNIATIFPTVKEYGECTSIIPILLCEKDSNTIILDLKPTYVYGKDFIEKMIETSDTNSKDVIYDKKQTTILFKPSHYNSDILNREQKYFTKKWFISKAKKTKLVNYNENYKILK